MDPNTSEQVRLLSIFHFVLAGFVALFSLLPILYVVVGMALMSDTLFQGHPYPPPKVFGWLFVVFGSIALAIGLTCAVLLALAGRFLSQHRYWIFCMVVAAVSCAFFPLGTILGVLTLVILSKPEVKAAFSPNGPSAHRTDVA